MDVLIYAPTAHALMWNMPEAQRLLIVDVLRQAQPLRAFTIYARVSIDPDFGSLSVIRLNVEQPLLFFDALERPLPLVTRLCDFWYPHLTAHIRPERHPRQARPDTLVVWGPPRAPLSAVRDSVPVHDPRTGHYLGRAFWRVDREGYWGCWSDSTENIGPALTLAELIALLNAERGVFAD
jgi:hypothetical protein